MDQSEPSDADPAREIGPDGEPTSARYGDASRAAEPWPDAYYASGYGSTTQSSNLDAAAVRRAWPEILAAAKERKKRTAALLVATKVRAVEGDKLILTVGTAPLARLLSEHSNTGVIVESLHAVLGGRWRVQWEYQQNGVITQVPIREPEPQRAVVSSPKKSFSEGVHPGDRIRPVTSDGDAALPEAKREPEGDNLGRGLAALIPTTQVTRNAGVFISYRRSDQAGLAGRLYDRLSDEFGESQVFMDVDSIELGLDFVEVLEETLAQCKALIVVIGKDWLTAKDVDGRRRIDHEGDFVRLEIETALKRNIRVIPILVDGTQMPRADQLPLSIAALSRRNGTDIWNARFKPDCMRLIETLRRILAAAVSAAAVERAKERSTSFDTILVPHIERPPELAAIEQVWEEFFPEPLSIIEGSMLPDEVVGALDAILTYTTNAEDRDIGLVLLPSYRQGLPLKKQLERAIRTLVEHDTHDIPCLLLTDTVSEAELNFERGELGSRHLPFPAYLRVWRSPADNIGLRGGLEKLRARLSSG